MQRYPRWAATMASPTPVFPEVGSTIVSPGSDRTGGLGLLDHHHGRPILDAAARVEVLELGQQVAREIAPDMVEADERGVSDQVEHAVGNVHRRSRVVDAGRRHLSPSARLPGGGP